MRDLQLDVESYCSRNFKASGFVDLRHLVLPPQLPNLAASSSPPTDADLVNIPPSAYRLIYTTQVLSHDGSLRSAILNSMVACTQSASLPSSSSLRFRVACDEDGETTKKGSKKSSRVEKGEIVIVQGEGDETFAKVPLRCYINLAPVCVEFGIANINDPNTPSSLSSSDDGMRVISNPNIFEEMITSASNDEDLRPYGPFGSGSSTVPLLPCGILKLVLTGVSSESAAKGRGVSDAKVLDMALSGGKGFVDPKVLAGCVIMGGRRGVEVIEGIVKAASG